MALHRRRVDLIELVAFGIVFVAGGIAAALVVVLFALYAQVAREARRETVAAVTPRDEQVYPLTGVAPHSWLVIRGGHPCVLVTHPAVAMDCGFWPVAETRAADQAERGSR